MRPEGQRGGEEEEASRKLEFVDKRNNNTSFENPMKLENDEGPPESSSFA